MAEFQRFQPFSLMEFFENFSEGFCHFQLPIKFHPAKTNAQYNTLKRMVPGICFIASINSGE